MSVWRFRIHIQDTYLFRLILSDYYIYVCILTAMFINVSINWTYISTLLTVHCLYTLVSECKLISKNFMFHFFLFHSDSEFKYIHTHTCTKTLTYIDIHIHTFTLHKKDVLVSKCYYKCCGCLRERRKTCLRCYCLWFTLGV